MLRSRTPFFVALLLVGAQAALGLASCADLSSSNTAVASITGIVVRAETLTRGRGCGPEPSQVFKVAAVVYGNDDASNALTVPLAANTYDCFSDVTFVDLPTSPRGSADYRIDVFLYNHDAYEARRSVVDRARASTGAGAETVREALDATPPTWSTSCRATQWSNVQSVAICDPVRAGGPSANEDGGATSPATIELATAEFTTATGDLLRCRANDAGAGDAGTADDAGDDDAGAADDAGDEDDASPDASDDDAGATDDAGASDAGAPAPEASGDFDTVRVRWRSGDVGGPIVDVACPAPFVLPNATPGSVILDVGLLSNGRPLGQTSCTATAISGQTSSAVCAPLP